MKYWQILCCLIFILAGCAPYEDQSYFEPVKSSDYLLDSFQGNTDFKLDGTFALTLGDINKIESIESFDGNSTASLSAIYIGDITKINERTVILYCHDKYGNLDNYWQRIKLLGNLGLGQYGILAIDYRGYGLSSGHSTEGSITADVASGIKWLEDKGLTSDRLVLYGFGLGTVPVVNLAAKPRSLTPARIILEAPIASMEALLQDAVYQSVPGHYLSGLDFNNADTIQSVTQPLLWFHGSDDDIYPPEHGQLVFNRHQGDNNSKLGFIVNGANHNNIPAKISIGQDSFNQYLLHIKTFFQNY